MAVEIVLPPGVTRLVPGPGILVDSTNPSAPIVEADPDYLGTVIFPFEVASDTWPIDHNLNCYPSVTIVDSSGNEVIGAVEYLSADSLVVTFSAPFSGTAYLN